MIQLPTMHRVLVVDDEPDVIAVTRLSLRSLQYNGHGVELVPAASGREAVESLRTHPNTSVILLDVVMETEHAGLDACRAIREQLGNRRTRILLRTGQPGVAPEKKAIDEYDIDGYLLKTELTTTRLYAAVRTALKAYEELTELERHRELLRYLHELTVQVRAFDGLEVALQKVLTAAQSLTNARLAVLSLRTFESGGSPMNCLLHSGGHEAAARDVAARVQGDRGALSLTAPATFGDGTLVPLRLHRELGDGWLYLEGGSVDQAAWQVLPLLAAQASNTLYAAAAQQLLEQRDGPFYDAISV